MTYPRIALMAVTLLTLSSLPNLAEAKNVRGSTGIGIGSSRFNYGLSLKHYMNSSSAVQLLVGGGWGHDLGLDADYLLEMPAIVDAGPVEVAWNVGGGIGVDLWNSYYRPYWENRRYSHRGLSVRAAFVAGLEFNIHAIDALPIDIVLEWRPTIGITPRMGFAVDNFAGNIRLYLF